MYHMNILPTLEKSPIGYDIEAVLQLLPNLPYYSSEPSLRSDIAQQDYRSRRYQGHSGISIKIISAKWLDQPNVSQNSAVKEMNNAGGVKCWHKVIAKRKEPSYLIARRLCKSSLMPFAAEEDQQLPIVKEKRLMQVGRPLIPTLAFDKHQALWSHCATLQFL